MLALKAKHRVYHMLEYFGTGDRAFLIDMTYEYHRNAVVFRLADKGHCRFAHL